MMTPPNSTWLTSLNVILLVTLEYPIGQRGVDAPYNLIEYMLQYADNVSGGPDIVLVPGDLVAHGISSKLHEGVAGNFTLLKETLTKVYNQIHA